MMFDEFERLEKFRAAWNEVRIERSVEYGLFTFGDSDLPYFLVTSSPQEGKLVSIRQGQVNVKRPQIITPDNMRPELRDFFEEQEEAGFIEYLMARTAAFSNLRLSNHSGPDKIVTDTVEEAVSRLNRQLDAEEEDRVAILSCPRQLAGLAAFRYASERILHSTPGNIQELRERGLLP
jgi:hypothetical protein